MVVAGIFISSYSVIIWDSAEKYPEFIFYGNIPIGRNFEENWERDILLRLSSIEKEISNLNRIQRFK
jgi:hypothetical protein